MKRRNFLRLGSGETIGGALAACGNQMLGPRARTVLDWNRLTLQAIGSTPDALPAARVLAILHTCMYNAWAAYDDNARQTVHGVAVRLPRAERSAASKASAMSHAAALTLTTLFPAQRPAVDACMARLGLDPHHDAGPFTPAAIGRAETAPMLDAWRRDDAALPFALSLWRDVDSDVLSEACRSVNGGADAAPALRWCRLAQEVGARDGYDDDRDVLLYFVLSHALGDAALAGADADVAAAEVLRSFSGSDRLQTGAPSFSETAAQARHARAQAHEEAARGRQVGAQVFEKARRYWQGKL